MQPDPGTSPSDEATQTSGRLMDDLMAEAKRGQDPCRSATLERLVAACDDILSGKAMQVAKANSFDHLLFDNRPKRLNSRIVEQYVRLRHRVDGHGNQWTGPVATTLRSEQRLMLYMKLRLSEATGPSPRHARTPQARKADDVIDGIPVLVDQATLRIALEEGRLAKRELDIVRHALRQLPGIEYDVLAGKRKAALQEIRGGMSAAETSLLRKLLRRLRDNPGLTDFGLVFRSGRLKSDCPPGNDLALPEEFELLLRLAGERKGRSLHGELPA